MNGQRQQEPVKPHEIWVLSPRDSHKLRICNRSQLTQDLTCNVNKAWQGGSSNKRTKVKGNSPRNVTGFCHNEEHVHLMWKQSTASEQKTKEEGQQGLGEGNTRSLSTLLSRKASHLLDLSSLINRIFINTVNKNSLNTYTLSKKQQKTTTMHAII